MIYGTGGKKLGEVLITNEKCPSCEKINTVYLHGVARYFHILWIPVFPFSKKLITICHSCENEISEKERLQSLKDKVDLEKGSLKLPVFLFAGLAIIIAFIGYLQYESKKHKEFVGDRIHNLQTDDVIVFKNSSTEYTFALVDSVINDTLTFKNSNYSIDAKPTKSDYINGITKKDDFFNDELYILSQKEVDSLFTIGELDIFEIDK